MHLVDHASCEPVKDQQAPLGCSRHDAPTIGGEGGRENGRTGVWRLSAPHSHRPLSTTHLFAPSLSSEHHLSSWRTSTTTAGSGSFELDAPFVRLVFRLRRSTSMACCDSKTTTRILLEQAGVSARHACTYITRCIDSPVDWAELHSAHWRVKPQRPCPLAPPTTQIPEDDIPVQRTRGEVAVVGRPTVLAEGRGLHVSPLTLPTAHRDRPETGDPSDMPFQQAQDTLCLDAADGDEAVCPANG